QEGQEPEVEGTEAVQTVSVQTDAPGSEGEVPENGAAEPAVQEPGLLSLGDLFDRAQRSSCSIDGVCDCDAAGWGSQLAAPQPVLTSSPGRSGRARKADSSAVKDTCDTARQP